LSLSSANGRLNFNSFGERNEIVDMHGRRPLYLPIELSGKLP